MRATKSISFNSYSVESEKVRKFLSAVPAEATLRINSHQGDRPWESAYTTIEANWEETE